jgi:1-acyl-sn-glycerol-3-phosphate acyltransferase
MEMLYFLFHWFVKLTAWIPQLIGFRIKVYYEDKSVQSKKIRGAAIIASNHNTVMDVAVMMFVFWRRTLRFFAAELMFEKNFFMTLILRMLGAIRVDRNSHDFLFLEKSARLLERGRVVEIYPESRLPRADEERPLEFKPSAVYLALETGAPIIPVYNARKSFADKPTRVMIGKPIYARELIDASLDEKQNIENITQILRGKIIELGKKLEEK